ncbi:MAG: flagellar FlbD family protein [Nocardioidaceae bacterium]|nr:flagellar FlbD family protein [Nocardioidaceae bacterium]MCL2613786.1 flagellar FlbD family protein [Nocardioidaceae bacterium]
MITLTRLSGSAFLLNADLIERVDSTPDTVVTLVDGTKYVVAEPLDVVLTEVVDYRARIVARASLIEDSATSAGRQHGTTGAIGSGRLTAVPAPRERGRGEER